MKLIKDSELLLNEEGRIYHLNLLPEDIAHNIILVGDPNRVQTISRFFSSVVSIHQNREFIVHTGFFNEKKISVISTGIGTDNIDIVLNELDALVNIDFKTKIIKENLISLNIIRIGTCGGISPDVEIDSFLLSNYIIGIDSLARFYNCIFSPDEIELSNEFVFQTNWDKNLSKPYAVKGSKKINSIFKNRTIQGITISAPGFFGPQGRELRIPLAIKNYHSRLRNFLWKNQNIKNFEMEGSAIFSLGKTLGHECSMVCLVVTNRATGEFSINYSNRMLELIQLVLDRITTLDC